MLQKSGYIPRLLNYLEVSGYYLVLIGGAFPQELPDTDTQSALVHSEPFPGLGNGSRTVGLPRCHVSS